MLLAAGSLGRSYLHGRNSRVTHAAVIVVACGLLAIGVISGAPTGLQAYAQAVGYWPPPASFKPDSTTTSRRPCREAFQFCRPHW
ncbi:MAG: hypothetical protein ACYCYK_06880 [Candidatus Dormibacteria bacterium]